MLNTKEVAQSLRKNGYKVTPQRLAVYEWLSHTQEHPTAEMLYSRLQPKYPSMSLSTVYKPWIFLKNYSWSRSLIREKTAIALMRIPVNMPMSNVWNVAG